MNQQEQATKHAAIFQDTINGTNDPTPMAGDHVGLVRRHDMDGRHCKDGRRGLGGHDLRSRRHHRAPEHNRRRRDLRHEPRPQTGGRAEPMDAMLAASNNGTTAIPTGGTPWPRRASTA